MGRPRSVLPQPSTPRGRLLFVRWRRSLADQRGRMIEIPLTLFALALILSQAVGAYQHGGWPAVGLRLLEILGIGVAVWLAFAAWFWGERAWQAAKARGPAWARAAAALETLADYAWDLTWRTLLFGFLVAILDAFLVVAVPDHDALVGPLVGAEFAALWGLSLWLTRRRRARERIETEKIPEPESSADGKAGPRQG